LPSQEPVLGFAGSLANRAEPLRSSGETRFALPTSPLNRVVPDIAAAKLELDLLRCMGLELPASRIESQRDRGRLNTQSELLRAAGREISGVSTVNTEGADSP
jgi:hypothetical protein